MEAVRKKYVSLLTILCVVAYFVSYLTRINYGTVLLEIVKCEGISNSAASMAVTGSFVTYGIGQVISGLFGDRLKPHLLIFAGLLVTALMNLLVPLFPTAAFMLVFWCINGMAQAMLWPPLVKIMSDFLTMEEYKKACVKVSFGGTLGTIALFLFSPLCIAVSGWKSVFLLCSSCAFVFSALWLKGFHVIENHLAAVENDTQSEEEKQAGIPGSSFAVLPLMILAIILVGGCGME